MFLLKKFAVVAVCAALLSGCATKNTAPRAPQGPKTSKPQVEFTCWPLIATGTMFGPVTFSATLRVHNPGEKFWCPKVEWYVNGELSSTHESDCDPYSVVAAEEGKEPEEWSEPTKFFGLPEGEHIISVNLKMSSKKIAHAECKVIAR